MTTQEFNSKYKDYLEEGHYGLDIENTEVVEYLDKEFEEEIKNNPSFKYAQIKTKYNWSCVYASGDKTPTWRNEIDRILQKKSLPCEN